MGVGMDGQSSAFQCNRGHMEALQINQEVNQFGCKNNITPIRRKWFWENKMLAIRII